jgi:hypothetical protein
MANMGSPSGIEHYRDLVELSDLREENKALKAALAEWIDMAENDVLCLPCNSGKGKACKECGIKLMEKQSKKLLRKKL